LVIKQVQIVLIFQIHVQKDVLRYYSTDLNFLDSFCKRGMILFMTFFEFFLGDRSHFYIVESGVKQYNSNF